VAAIGVTAPSGAMNQAGWQAIARDTVVAAGEVSHALGGRLPGVGT
jgi:hypothetical protein